MSKMAIHWKVTLKPFKQHLSPSHISSWAVTWLDAPGKKETQECLFHCTQIQKMVMHFAAFFEFFKQLLPTIYCLAQKFIGIHNKTWRLKKKSNHSIQISELNDILIFFNQHLPTHFLSQAETLWNASDNMETQNSLNHPIHISKMSMH